MSIGRKFLEHYFLLIVFVNYKFSLDWQNFLQKNLRDDAPFLFNNIFNLYDDILKCKVLFFHMLLQKYLNT